jgi:hypothetical protein
VRGGELMRVMFTVTLALIVTGLVFFFLIGLAHR